MYNSCEVQGNSSRESTEIRFPMHSLCIRGRKQLWVWIPKDTRTYRHRDVKLLSSPAFLSITKQESPAATAWRWRVLSWPAALCCELNLPSSLWAAWEQGRVGLAQSVAAVLPIWHRIRCNLCYYYVCGHKYTTCTSHPARFGDLWCKKPECHNKQ